MLLPCFVVIKGHREGGMTYRRRKTDGAYPWTVLHLRSTLLPQQWMSLYQS